jgi:hypothetical protein
MSYEQARQVITRLAAGSARMYIPPASKSPPYGKRSTATSGDRPPPAGEKESVRISARRNRPPTPSNTATTPWMVRLYRKAAHQTSTVYSPKMNTGGW